MDYKQINKLLDNLQNPKNNKALKFIEKIEGHQGVDTRNGDGYQGEYNEYSEIFQVISDPETFIRFTYQTDSYGDNESISDIKFVKGTKKIIEVFEPIK